MASVAERFGMSIQRLIDLNVDLASVTDDNFIVDGQEKVPFYLHATPWPSYTNPHPHSSLFRVCLLQTLKMQSVSRSIEREKTFGNIMHICIYTCVCIYVYICVYIYICMFICIYVCIYVYIDICMYTYIYISIHMYRHIYTYMCIYLCV